MLLAITTTHRPATDLGYLLRKSPYRCQSFPLNSGNVRVFYPEAAEEKCTAVMLLDMDPVEMARGKRGAQIPSMMSQYINDRPYVASSLMSGAIARVFGSALNGQCTARPELVDVVMPIAAAMPVLPCRGGEVFLKRLFEPLGYQVAARRYVLDDKFPEWGDSDYFSVELQKATTVKELLTHLYVLIPVLDDQKHYYIDSVEVDKLLKRGQGWLAQHPEKEAIARRYLKHRASLAREALSRLTEEAPPEPADGPSTSSEDAAEKKLNLNEERLEAVLAELKSSGARTVIDLGCGEGKLLRILLKDRQFQKITGMDVSIRALETARERLRLDELPAMQRQRIELIHGSLMYRDARFGGYDAATAIEVIEHLDQARLAAFERVVFECAKPKLMIITTPNREYNAVWENLPGLSFRHPDHRFEWSRAEFHGWATAIAEKYGYHVRFASIGRDVDNIGSPTQIAVFTRGTM